jgi:predicted MPP superfamily phosphohydrolase
MPIAAPSLVMYESAACYRLVVLSDPHLPVREHAVKSSAKQQKIIEAKNKVIEDINGWEDIRQVVVLGDIVADLGTEKENDYAAQYFSKFNKPLSFIAGNHDYIYEDTLSPEGKRVRGDASYRERKLDIFKQTFSLPEVFYSQKLGNYFLLFLSVDSLDSRYLAQISERQLTWLRGELAKNTAMPTIVFFHAPLKGTVSNYNATVNGPNFIAQPEQAIAEIINSNPQIFLWVSGHNHTPATNPDFASATNVFAGRVTNVHNADMDRETIWTNSLYLYPDKVMIKTFDHKKGTWIDAIERTIYLPNR